MIKVNGPINRIVMNKNNKNMELLINYYASIGNETSCDVNEQSIDIEEYIIRHIDNNRVDFFLMSVTNNDSFYVGDYYEQYNKLLNAIGKDKQKKKSVYIHEINYFDQATEICASSMSEIRQTVRIIYGLKLFDIHNNYLVNIYTAFSKHLEICKNVRNSQTHSKVCDDFFYIKHEKILLDLIKQEINNFYRSLQEYLDHGNKDFFENIFIISDKVINYSKRLLSLGVAVVFGKRIVELDIIIKGVIYCDIEVIAYLVLYLQEHGFSGDKYFGDNYKEVCLNILPKTLLQCCEIKI